MRARVLILAALASLVLAAGSGVGSASASSCTNVGYMHGILPAMKLGERAAYASSYSTALHLTQLAYMEASLTPQPCTINLVTHRKLTLIEYQAFMDGYRYALAGNVKIALGFMKLGNKAGAAANKQLGA
jgi:hypothetical protein